MIGLLSQITNSSVHRDTATYIGLDLLGIQDGLKCELEALERCRVLRHGKETTVRQRIRFPTASNGNRNCLEQWLLCLSPSRLNNTPLAVKQV